MEEFKFTCKVTAEDIDNIMCSALEGGITYWCGGMKVVNEDYKGAEYGHEVISRGGKLRLYDEEAEKSYILTRGKFLKGLGKYSNHDFDSFDAGDADNIVQLALFGEIIYA